MTAMLCWIEIVVLNGCLFFGAFITGLLLVCGLAALFEKGCARLMSRINADLLTAERTMRLVEQLHGLLDRQLRASQRRRETVVARIPQMRRKL